jgi:SnoaL-like domain
MDFQQAEALANEWIKAWKRRDSEAVASHYSEDVEFQSPLVVHLLGEPSGTVSGKQNLEDYFRKVLEAFPGELGIELVGVYQGVSSILVHFQAKGRRAIEVMELDGEGKIHRALTLVQP